MFLRGDANSDLQIDISDAVGLLLHLFDDRKMSCLDACDVNDDGALDIADAVYILAYLFADGSFPEMLFPDCGQDNTPDDLDCSGVSGC